MDTINTQDRDHAAIERENRCEKDDDQKYVDRHPQQNPYESSAYHLRLAQWAD